MSLASSPDDSNWAETKKRLDAHRVNKIHRVKHNLHKLPQGPAIMQYLASGKFDGAKNLKGLLLNLKKKDMVPEASASLAEADRLLSAGCTDLYFEDNTNGDVDVGALTSTGESVAAQVKTTTMTRRATGLRTTIKKALRQLRSVPATHKIIVFHFFDGSGTIFDTKFRKTLEKFRLPSNTQIRIVYPDSSHEFI
ncbi:MAG: hypothetical protein ACPGWR_09010 [Ardenticatenaceae bacterium]